MITYIKDGSDDIQELMNGDDREALVQRAIEGMATAICLELLDMGWKLDRRTFAKKLKESDFAEKVGAMLDEQIGPFRC